MRISDWSSDVCSSDLTVVAQGEPAPVHGHHDGIDGILMGGTILGAGAGTPPRPVVVLDVVLVVATAHPAVPPVVPALTAGPTRTRRSRGTSWRSSRCSRDRKSTRLNSSH